MIPLRHLSRSTCLTAASILCFTAGYVQANPVGGTVSAGQATISQSGSKVDIHQSTDKAVIDWRGFDIAPGETTQFYQPGSGSITLNRVHSASASHIDGNLLANGNVIIINQNGVMFGRGAKVDVNGLVATTADISNHDFMNATGKLNFNKASTNANARIENNGTITVGQAGLVGFVAPNVINHGTITAKLGRVQLASGDTATVDMYGDGLMEVAVSDKVKSQLVKNTGTISADGGIVALTAAQGRNIVNSLITNSGVIQAQSIGVKNGQIVISNANTGGKIRQRGTLDATGKTVGSKGGSVQLFADDILLDTGSVIDASGANGGGTILVGGDRQGAGNNHNAVTTTVAKGASLIADALTSGNGGVITVWANNATDFEGSLSARALGASGNGGSAEISGKNTLHFDGLVNLTAAHGTKGSILFDPTDITIYGHSGTGDGTNSFNATQLENLSNYADVYLHTSDDITLDLGGDTMTFAPGSNFFLTAGHDLLSASGGSIFTSGSAGFTFVAGHDLVFTGSLQLNVQGSGNVLLQADHNVDSDASITTHGGNVTIMADHSYAGGRVQLSPNGNITTHGGDVSIGGGNDPLHNYAQSDDEVGVRLNYMTIDASGVGHGGNITVMGAGNPTGSVSSENGIELDGSTLITNGQGNITLQGKGGENYATAGIISYVSSITAENGTISLTGLSPSPYGNSVGLSLSNTTLTTTGTGNVRIESKNDYAGSNTLIGGLTIQSGGGITFIGDHLDNISSWTAANTITFRPENNGTSIGINGGAGSFQIGSNILDQLTANKIVFGDGTMDSAITLDGSYNWRSSVGLINKSSDINVTGNQVFGTNDSFSATTVTGGNIIIGNVGLTTAGTGSITLTAANKVVENLFATLISDAGNIALKGTHGIELTYGTQITSTTGNISFLSPLTVGTSQEYVTGGNINFSSTVNGNADMHVSANTATLSGAWGNTTALNYVEIATQNSIVLPAMKLLQTIIETMGPNANITLGGDITSTTPTDPGIYLVALHGKFLNPGRHSLINLGAPNARWLIYADSSTGTVLGGLTAPITYNCNLTGFGSCALPATGNGILYGSSYVPPAPPAPPVLPSQTLINNVLVPTTVQQVSQNGALNISNDMSTGSFAPTSNLEMPTQGASGTALHSLHRWLEIDPALAKMLELSRPKSVI